MSTSGSCYYSDTLCRYLRYVVLDIGTYNNVEKPLDFALDLCAQWFQFYNVRAQTQAAGQLTNYGFLQIGKVIHTEDFLWVTTAVKKLPSIVLLIYCMTKLNYLHSA